MDNLSNFLSDCRHVHMVSNSICTLVVLLTCHWFAKVSSGKQRQTEKEEEKKEQATMGDFMYGLHAVAIRISLHGVF